MLQNTRSGRVYRSIVTGFAIGGALGLAFLGGYFYRDRFVQPPESTLSFELLSEADALLTDNFLGEFPEEEQRVYGAVRGLVGSLNDPFTFFVEPQRHEIESANLAGLFGGIGAELSRDDAGRFVMVTVYRDGPGFEAGLRDGDVLLEIDGMPVDSGAPGSDAIIALIRGEVGEPVLLGILRAEEILDFEVIREEIAVPAVVWRILDEDERIGYIRLSRFTARAPEELEMALDELQSEGAAAYVLDLRDNGGGLVDASVKVVSQFLDGDLVLSEERRNNGLREFRATQGGPALDEPLVVLVNGNTASASEIVAGALQDRERALVIGQQTFGKGSVQVILEMSNGASLHVTSARWFTPNNLPIDNDGLTPDVVVEPVEDMDAFLLTAIDHLAESLVPSG